MGEGFGHHMLFCRHHHRQRCHGACQGACLILTCAWREGEMDAEWKPGLGECRGGRGGKE